VGNTQGAIGIDADSSGSADDETIENNVVYGSLVYDAIDVCGSNGTTVTANTVSNSGQSAIHLDSTCALYGGPVGGTATVSGNILNEACAGILNGSAGNTIGTNTSNNLANTTLVADTATCTPPSGGDAVGALTDDSGQKKPQVARP